MFRSSSIHSFSSMFAYFSMGIFRGNIHEGTSWLGAATPQEPRTRSSSSTLPLVARRAPAVRKTLRKSSAPSPRHTRMVRPTTWAKRGQPAPLKELREQTSVASSRPLLVFPPLPPQQRSTQPVRTNTEPQRGKEGVFLKKNAFLLFVSLCPG